ncbi:MAG: hypothetical protein AAGD06_24590, partial [Acidobacteriota bacterium]
MHPHPDLEILIRTEGGGSGVRLRFELHSPNGRVPFTRHRVGESVALGATTLAEYAERKLVAFQALDSPAHV